VILGNCYLISAIISLSKFDELITDKFFITKPQINEFGVYCAKLFDDGIEKAIWVDEKIPKNNVNIQISCSIKRDE